MSKTPNILVFFTDDQRFDTIRALGNQQIHTPHIDALVARGTSFTHAHIPGGTSGAVCMPSRGMLHSGRTLFHLDREGQEIPREHTTLGECFRAAGYDTFGTGKWHSGTDAYARSFSTGDEIFFGGMEDHWNVPACHFDPTGNYANRRAHVSNPGFANRVGYWNADHIHVGTHSTDLFTDTSIKFIESRETDQPFFLYLSLMAPHDPRSMPEKYREMYDPDAIDLPTNFQEEHAIDTGALKIRDEMLAGFPRNPEEIRRHIAEYYAMITHLDDALGRLTAALQASGELENTIIVFAGDNGLALGQHGLMGKQNLYDHSVRVPLILAGPGIPVGQEREALVYLLDIFPTLCDLTGQTVPASVEGQSFASCLHDGNIRTRDDLYLAYVDSIRGVSDGKHKLIEYACGETQLFDLVNDPAEIHSLAEDPSSNELLASLRKRLVAFAETWDDAEHPAGATFWAARPDLPTHSARTEK